MFIQTFKISVATGAVGAWFSKVDLFFKKKSATFGCKVHLCHFENGRPNPSLVVAGSTVVVPSSKIVTSPNGSSKTTFTFNNLVYLEKEKRYGIVITPEGAYPEYELWTGRVGETDFETGRRLTANPLLEGSYAAQNGVSMREESEEDVKFTLYRARFLQTGTGANIKLESIPTVVLVVKNDTLALPEGISIEPGTIIVKTDAERQPILNGPRGVVHIYESGRIRLTNLTGVTSVDHFQPFDTIAILLPNGGVVGSATISNVESFQYRSLVPRLGLQTMGVNVKADLKVAKGSTTSPSFVDPFPVTVDSRVQLRDGAGVFASHPVEISSLGDMPSITLDLQFPPSDGFQTPVFNLYEANFVLERQVINNVSAASDLEHTNNGLAGSKYVSKIVTLPEDLEAEDLRVYITAFKPVGSTIDVYGKFLAPEDDDLFDNKLWTKLTLKGNPNKYSSEDENDLIEYEYAMPEGTAPVAGAAYLDPTGTPAGVLTYISGTTKFRTFGQYAVKIVLKSDPTSKSLPALADMRAIALQI